MAGTQNNAAPAIRHMDGSMIITNHLTRTLEQRGGRRDSCTRGLCAADIKTFVHNGTTWWIFCLECHRGSTGHLPSNLATSSRRLPRTLPAFAAGATE